MDILLIRADANNEIGTGHVMRCLGLAQAWKNHGGSAVFLSTKMSPALKSILALAGFGIQLMQYKPGSQEDAKQVIDLATKLKSPWVVVDGYYFGGDYQKTIKDSELRLMFIDDKGDADYYLADIILNQNISAQESYYNNRASYTMLLLGCKYALIRQEFLECRDTDKKISETASKVLITLGGGNAGNTTLFRIVEALEMINVKDLEAVITVGASNTQHDILKVLTKRTKMSLRLEGNVLNMPSLMKWADVAISSGGITSWELAFMGTPSAIVVLTGNQQPIASGLSEAGIIVNLGWHDQVSTDKMAKTIEKLIHDPKKRLKMSLLGRQLVDGEGASRVIMNLRGERLRLRSVADDDCRLLWEWANDPGVRKASFSPEKILYKKHLQWFRSKMCDPKCHFYIGINKDDIPVGQVRYDLKQKNAVISVSIAPEFREQGYGSLLIYISSERLFTNSQIDTISAYIKPENEISTMVFKKAGFQDKGLTSYSNHPARLMIKRKDKVYLS